MVTQSTPADEQQITTYETSPMVTSTNEQPNEQQGVPNFTFSEEPLGIPASEGYGYFQGGPGLVIGPNNRFLIQAKLGFGTASSVWLARDLSENKHVAIKILSGYATQLNHEHKLRELEVLQCLSSITSQQPDHLARLATHFFHQGIEDDGEHLCLVMDLFHGSVDEARDFHGVFIPVPTVKRILRHLLLGIAHLHKCGVAHTDLKPDNIMIDLGDNWPTEVIDSWVKANPPRTYAPERSLHKMVSPIVSQSFPPATLDELVSCNFRLADFSNGFDEL